MKQTGPWGMPTGFCFSKQLQFGVCKASGTVGSVKCLLCTHRQGKASYGAKNAVSSSRGQFRLLRCPPAMPEAWSITGCFAAETAISCDEHAQTYQGLEHGTMLRLSFLVFPKEPELFSELTTLKKKVFLNITLGTKLGLIVLVLFKPRIFWRERPWSKLGNFS